MFWLVKKCGFDFQKALAYHEFYKKVSRGSPDRRPSRRTFPETIQLFRWVLPRASRVREADPGEPENTKPDFEDLLVEMVEL